MKSIDHQKQIYKTWEILPVSREAEIKAKIEQQGRKRPAFSGNSPDKENSNDLTNMAKKKKGNKKPGGYQSPQKTPHQLEEPKCKYRMPKLFNNFTLVTSVVRYFPVR